MKHENTQSFSFLKKRNNLPAADTKKLGLPIVSPTHNSESKIQYAFSLTAARLRSPGEQIAYQVGQIADINVTIAVNISKFRR